MVFLFSYFKNFVNGIKGKGYVYGICSGNNYGSDDFCSFVINVSVDFIY